METRKIKYYFLSIIILINYSDILLDSLMGINSFVYDEIYMGYY